MKASYHNGRATKAGNVYNANHNTKIETRERQKHIDHEKTLENVVWARDINNLSSKKLIRQEGSFDARAYELQFYKDRFGAARERKNAEYIRTGHKSDVRTMEQVINNEKTAPLETIYQIGKEKEHVTPEQLEKIFREFTNWMQKEYGSNMEILDVALHVDEATPHIHARYVFFARDRNGDLDVNQTAAFKELGIERPDPQKKVGKYNNSLMTFTERNRERFYEICEERGIEINREVENPSQKHLDVLAFKSEALQKENRELQEKLQSVQEKMQRMEGQVQEAAERKERIDKAADQVKEAALREAKTIQSQAQEVAEQTTAQAQQQAQEIEKQAQEQAAQQKAAAAAQAASIKQQAASEAEQMIANAAETAQEAQRQAKEAQEMKEHALEEKSEIEARTAQYHKTAKILIEQARKVQKESQVVIAASKRLVEDALKEYDRVKKQHDELEADIQELEKYEYSPSQIARVKQDIDRAKKDAQKKGWLSGREIVPVDLDTIQGMYVKLTRYENLETLQNQLAKKERDLKFREGIVESSMQKIEDREKALQLPEAELESKIQQRINSALELNNNIYKNKAELYDSVVAQRDQLRDEVNEYHAIASGLEITQGVTLQKIIDTVHHARTQNVVQKVLDVVGYLAGDCREFTQEIINLAIKTRQSISKRIHRGR